MTRMEVPPQTAIHCKITLLVDYIKCELIFCVTSMIFFFDVRVASVPPMRMPWKHRLEMGFINSALKWQLTVIIRCSPNPMSSYRRVVLFLLASIQTSIYAGSIHGWASM